MQNTEKKIFNVVPDDSITVEEVAEAAMATGIIHNMPMTVTTELVRSSILEAHELGEAVAKDFGDEAYRRLQGE